MIGSLANARRNLNKTRVSAPDFIAILNGQKLVQFAEQFEKYRSDLWHDARHGSTLSDRLFPSTYSPFDADLIEDDEGNRLRIKETREDAIIFSVVGKRDMRALISLDDDGRMLEYSGVVQL